MKQRCDSVAVAARGDVGTRSQPHCGAGDFSAAAAVLGAVECAAAAARGARSEAERGCTINIHRIAHAHMRLFAARVSSHCSIGMD